MSWRLVNVLGITLVALAIGPARGDDPAVVADGRNTPGERLESMRAMMKGYRLTLQDDSAPPFELQEEPAFRVGRQKGNFVDGAIFLWMDDVGRPEAAMEAFLLSEDDAPDGKWIHEFTSLSTRPIAASRNGNRCWFPAVAGLEFRPVPNAPSPAATTSARYRQMSAIAANFHADDNFGDRGWEVLRMLTKPIARYGKAGKTPEDGALFAFVEGTDPEVFLFLEVREAAGRPEWQYALASMGCWAMKVRFTGQEVWNLPRRSTGDPTWPLYNFQFWP
jgi:hypothetical protein